MRDDGIAYQFKFSDLIGKLTLSDEDIATIVRHVEGPTPEAALSLADGRVIRPPTDAASHAALSGVERGTVTLDDGSVAFLSREAYKELIDGIVERRPPADAIRAHRIEWR